MSSDPSLRDIADPEAFARHGYPHAAWAFLRKNDPVHWWDLDERHFWAITTHADVAAVLKKPRIFSLSGRRALTLDGGPGKDTQFRDLTNMDPPEHGVYRAIINRCFTPAAVRKLDAKVERIVGEQVDALAQREACDLVDDFAAKIPMAVIGGLIGTPDEDAPKILRWINIIGGANDPEYANGVAENAIVEETASELFSYFADFIVEKTQNPTDDFGSIVAAAEIDGEPMSLPKMLAYFFMLLIAGNETTRNVIAGGVLAFIEHPDQLDKLRKNPELMPGAVEELVRWTSPLIQFARVAMEDTELHGKKIRKGDDLYLFYPSANRDETVFGDPFSFRIDRSPNPHLGFAIGEHFCLGINLARLELATVFRQLSQRWEQIEVAGNIERLRSSVMGGIKHLPVKARLSAARPSL